MAAVMLGSAPSTGAQTGSSAPDGARESVARDRVPMQVYFGTTHAHTGADNDHGRDNSHARDIFETARAYDFDFLLLTEHSGSSGPTNPVEFYADARAQAAATTQDDAFVGLAGYEYSDNSRDDGRGHLTVYGTDDFVNAMAPGMNFENFYDYLVRQSTQHTVFAGFNHPRAAGHAASARSYLDEDRRPIVPLSEAINGVVDGDSSDRRNYQSFVSHLDRGWRVAPTCGLDGHGRWLLKQGESDTLRPCRAGVLAPRLTTDEVIRAIMARRVYASADLNLRARYTANEKWMGANLGTPARVSLNIWMADPDILQARDKVTRIQVIGRDGKVVASRAFDAHQVRWQPTVDRGRNSYLFVRVFTGERQLTAVLAPVWFR